MILRLPPKPDLVPRLQSRATSPHQGVVGTEIQGAVETMMLHFRSDCHLVGVEVEFHPLIFSQFWHVNFVLVTSSVAFPTANIVLSAFILHGSLCIDIRSEIVVDHVVISTSVLCAGTSRSRYPRLSCSAGIELVRL